MLKKITVAPIKNITPKDGVVDSRDLNASIGSLITTSAVFAEQWNSQLADLLNSMPGGGRVISISERTSTPNAFSNGIDGANLFIDLTANSKIENGEYFKTSSNRPFTIKEYISKVKIDTNIRLSKLESSITLLQSIDSTGLTNAQKEAIGLRIFDNTQTSIPSSLDGKISALTQNIQQIMADIFNGRALPLHGHIAGTALHNVDYALSGGANQSLDVTVFDWINAIAYATGHTVDLTSGKPIVDHNFVITNLPQTDVLPTSQSGPLLSDLTDDTFTGPATNLADDLNIIRNILKQIKGTAGWDTTPIPSALFGGENNIVDIAAFQGTGTASANNIFGYDISDLSDNNGLLTSLVITSGEAINAGEIVCINTSGGGLYKANASDTNKTFAFGVASNSVAGAGLPVTIKTGTFTISGVYVAGSTYYLSASTPGAITATPPSGSGEYVVRVGKAIDAATLLVKISDDVRVA